MLTGSPRRLFLGALLLSGCATAEVSETTQIRYTWGAEVNVLSACGSDLELWVTGSKESVAELRAAHDSLTSSPYQGIFAEVTTRDSDAASDGFAEMYDGLIEVVDVISVSAEIPERCRPGGGANPS